GRRGAGAPGRRGGAPRPPLGRPDPPAAGAAPGRGLADRRGRPPPRAARGGGRLRPAGGGRTRPGRRPGRGGSAARARCARAARAGAAGGTGYGFAAAWGADITPGAAELCRIVGLDRQLARADLVITGEGGYAATSGDGKVTGTVLAAAARAAVPAALVAG